MLFGAAEKQFNPLKSDKSNYQVIKIDFAQRVVCAMSQAGLCLCYVYSPAKCGAMLVCHHWQTHIRQIISSHAKHY